MEEHREFINDANFEHVVEISLQRDVSSWERSDKSSLS
jgi:hypothetical protein